VSRGRRNARVLHKMAKMDTSDRLGEYSATTLALSHPLLVGSHDGESVRLA
jgi:hypothetical protein